MVARNEHQRLFYDGLMERFQNRILGHFLVNLIWAVLIMVLLAFGPGYQAVPILFLPCIVLIVLYARSAPSCWCLILVLWPAMTVGSFFAFAGSFQTTQPSPWQTDSTIYVLPITAAMAALVTMGLAVDRNIARFKLLPFIEIFFTFPMIWSGIWSALARIAPTGDFGNWGYALSLIGIDSLTLGVTWFFGAISGGSYVFAICVACLIFIFKKYLKQLDHDRKHFYSSIVKTNIVPEHVNL